MIARNLSQLKQINLPKAIELAQHIKITYKRRINLMKRIGENHYIMIARNLSQLKQINLLKAIELAQHIKITYKRRINLMKKIKEVDL
jgi:hypothetical protein